MKKTKIVVAATAVLAVLAGLSGLFGSGLDFITALNVSETLVMTVLHIGICILFIMGLKTFTAAFRRAYLFICAGVILLAVAVLQYTVLGSANALDSFWVTSGAIELAFVFSILCLLVGMALFARLMGVKHLARFIWLTVGVAIIASAAATFVPSPRTDIDPQMLFVTSALYTFQAVFLIAFLPLAYRIRKNAGPLYASMFAWMFTSFVVYAVQLVVTVYGLFYFSHDHWYVVYGVTMAFFFVAALCLLKAAIELNRIRFAEPPPRFTQFSFYGKPLGQKDTQTNSAIQAIVYLAGLTSDQTAIDSLLDDLRLVTSQLSPQPGPQPINDEQQTTLAEVYLKLEDYLASQEKIGKFTREQLRNDSLRRFQSPGETTFWSILEGAPRASS
jgi:hypothetical protein